MPPPAAECTDGACARKSEMFTAMRDALHAVDGARAASSPPCPLDIDSLGTSSWGLFHTLAAYYPVRHESLIDIDDNTVHAFDAHSTRARSDAFNLACLFVE
uniref:Sulfhydryl oxidase n=1 Tax=Ostreococcus mediterraneus TaxID=1486918 RepID=A0A7S0PQB4_9CHLO|mmetsp:Transcript_700/g.2734  ORF Transcript_700/g.2734 Transcript_700/m.2734 type:complete len:102 (+) Transcript_700:28-333(+)